MAKQPKPYECPLSPDLAADILNIPLDTGGHDGAPPRTIGERVRRSTEAIDEANRHLAESPVARIVAISLMQRLKKRGTPSILVRYDGTVILRIHYGEEGNGAGKAVRMRRDAPEIQTTHTSDLPYLEDLRAEASDLGLDISHLGRQRRIIHEFIEAHKRNVSGEVEAAPR